MLRIRYKGRKTTFLYDIKKREAADVIFRHVYVMFPREIVIDPETGAEIQRDVNLEDVTAEWQEGGGHKWDDALPTETVPVPPKPKRVT